MTLQTILAFATPVGLYLLLGVINLLLGHKSQIDAWAEANPRLAAVMKLSRSLGLDPWMLVQSLSLVIRGRLPATMKPEPSQERVSLRPPPKPPSIPPLGPMAAMLCLALCLLLAACAASSPSKPRPCSAEDKVLPAKLADCKLRMLTECKGLEPEACPVRNECRAWVRDYCGGVE